MFSMTCTHRERRAAKEGLFSSCCKYWPTKSWIPSQLSGIHLWWRYIHQPEADWSRLMKASEAWRLSENVFGNWKSQNCGISAKRGNFKRYIARRACAPPSRSTEYGSGCRAIWNSSWLKFRSCTCIVSYIRTTESKLRWKAYSDTPSALEWWNAKMTGSVDDYEFPLWFRWVFGVKYRLYALQEYRQVRIVIYYIVLDMFQYISQKWDEVIVLPIEDGWLPWFFLGCWHTTTKHDARYLLQ